MIQGTASHAGKTVVAAALARLFHRAGWRVAPFKAQNLSLNAVVAAGTLSGDRPGEIGWAQALQAAACGLAPTLDMNPVLLKPTDGGCQLVVRGRVHGHISGGGYGRYPPVVMAEVAGALARLRREHDLVILEGAGSPAEINLLDRDLANRWAAQAADAPILLVGDIERGGVFASLYGTWALSPSAERIRGFLINKLHGGAASLQPGLRELERRTGVPTVGVIPWREPELPEEDSLALERPARPAQAGELRLGVVRLPHIANFTDFEELARAPGVNLFYSCVADELAAADVILLPGSKSTVADLQALRARGLDEVVRRAAEAGKTVVGICGGYQMLGDTIDDPEGVESDPGRLSGPELRRVRGLGLLPVRTEFRWEKRTEWVKVRDGAGRERTGYFIHNGCSRRHGGEAWFEVVAGAGEDATEGCRLGRVAGTALHGVLGADWVRQWRAWAGLADLGSPPAQADLNARLDAWADHVAANLDWGRIERLASN